jgi:hypothetical protein
MDSKTGANNQIFKARDRIVSGWMSEIIKPPNAASVISPPKKEGIQE